MNHYISQLRRYGYGQGLIPEYGYQRFNNGVRIADIMRRCYRDLDQTETSNPFDTFPEYLNQASGLLSAISSWSITNLMYYIWQQRIDLQQFFELTILEDRIHYALWFINHAPEYNIDDYFINNLADKLGEKESKYKFNLILAKILGKASYRFKKYLKKSFWLSNIIKTPLKKLLKKLS